MVGGRGGSCAVPSDHPAPSWRYRRRETLGRNWKWRTMIIQVGEYLGVRWVPSTFIIYSKEPYVMLEHQAPVISACHKSDTPGLWHMASFDYNAKIQDQCGLPRNHIPKDRDHEALRR